MSGFAQQEHSRRGRVVLRSYIGKKMESGVVFQPLLHCFESGHDLLLMWHSFQLCLIPARTAALLSRFCALLEYTMIGCCYPGRLRMPPDADSGVFTPSRTTRQKVVSLTPHKALRSLRRPRHCNARQKDANTVYLRRKSLPPARGFKDSRLVNGLAAGRRPRLHRFKGRTEPGRPR